MSSFFSKIKNWQLFLLLMFPYIILIFSKDIGAGYFKLIFSLFLLFLPFIIVLFWFISIGNFLGHLSEEKSKTTYFNINFILIIAYIVFVYAYAYLQSGDTFSTNITIISTNESDKPLFTGSSALIMTIFSFYIVFAIFF